MSKDRLNIPRKLITVAPIYTARQSGCSMIVNMMRAVIELDYRAVVPLENAKGAKVDCLRGRLWISEWGRRDDIVLNSGQSYVIAGGGVTLVQALRNALVELPAACSVGPAGERLRHYASMNDHDENAPGITCPITASQCEGDLAYLCTDYGCARKGGLSPHSQEN